MSQLKNTQDEDLPTWLPRIAMNSGSRFLQIANCRCLAGSGQHKPGLVYLNPTLQNPTTITMPEHRRKKFASIAKRCNVHIVEDDPYWHPAPPS